MKDLKIDADFYSLILSHTSANPLPNPSTLGNITTVDTKEGIFNYNYYYYPYYYSHPINSTISTTTTTATATGGSINYYNSFDNTNLFYLEHPHRYIMSHETDLQNPHGQSGKKARNNNKKERQSRSFSAELQEEVFSSSSSPIIKRETLSSPASPSSSSPNLSAYSFNSSSAIETSTAATAAALSYQHQRLQQLQQQQQQLQFQQQQLSSSSASSASSTTLLSSVSSTTTTTTTAASSPSFNREIIKEMELELDHLRDELHIFCVLMDCLKTTLLDKDGFYRTNPSGSLRLSQPQQHAREIEKERRFAYDNLVQDIDNVEKRFESLLAKLDTLKRMGNHFD